MRTGCMDFVQRNESRWGSLRSKERFQVGGGLIRGGGVLVPGYDGAIRKGSWVAVGIQYQVPMKGWSGGEEVPVARGGGMGADGGGGGLLVAVQEVALVGEVEDPGGGGRWAASGGQRAARGGDGGAGGGGGWMGKGEEGGRFRSKLDPRKFWLMGLIFGPRKKGTGPWELGGFGLVAVGLKEMMDMLCSVNILGKASRGDDNCGPKMATCGDDVREGVDSGPPVWPDKSLTEASRRGYTPTRLGE